MISSTTKGTRAAIYARVSTADQTCENQLLELHRYSATRAWAAVDFVDHGVSGAKDRRPALDQLVADARRRRFDVLVVWRLDRLGRNLRHLVTLLEELQALGIAFVSLAEGIDATTPAGKLQMHILAAIAEFERARIAERVRAGLARVKARGQRLGRRPHRISDGDLERVATLSDAGIPAVDVSACGRGQPGRAVPCCRRGRDFPRTGAATCTPRRQRARERPERGPHLTVILGTRVYDPLDNLLSDAAARGRAELTFHTKGAISVRGVLAAYVKSRR